MRQGVDWGRRGRGGYGDGADAQVRSAGGPVTSMQSLQYEVRRRCRSALTSLVSSKECGRRADGKGGEEEQEEMADTDERRGAVDGARRHVASRFPGDESPETFEFGGFVLHEDAPRGFLVHFLLRSVVVVLSLQLVVADDYVDVHADDAE